MSRDVDVAALAEGVLAGDRRVMARAITLVESRRATWLHGLGSEHWWLYQLNLRNAGAVLVSLLQSETNYDQGDHAPALPPAPWTADAAAWLRTVMGAHG